MISSFMIVEMIYLSWHNFINSSELFNHKIKTMATQDSDKKGGSSSSSSKSGKSSGSGKSSQSSKSGNSGKTSSSSKGSGSGNKRKMED